ncbi:MAG: DsrE/DsrF/DrsH-like family protein, partial [Gammaproteobacteria bacterium]|nr:DsrE/DsrF/DrsH-like family protein [Gammaproteobacteria bacterium]
QGRIAADHIFGRNSRYRKSQGTGICKVFDLTAAMTGMNEKTLRASQMNYENIYLNENDHAGYYPGATPIALKVLFHPETGQLLGAQAVGNKGIDKRIDVLALAIRAQLTVFDLEHAELAYAPPYGSAKDIINYAGFVAVNWMRGDSNMCHVQDVLNKDEKTLLLDIRTRTEYKNGTIPNAINIPLSKLREELNQLDKNKKIIVFCKSGPRAHNACRILMQKGFDCRNLSGGYEIYMLATGTYQKDPNKGITPATKAMPLEMKISKSIDACGMQCPGPILKLKEEIETLETGNILSITTSDKGFLRDAPAWCRQAGHELLKTVSENGLQTSYIRKQTSVCSTNTSLEKNMSVVVFDDNFDRAVAAFIIANGAAAMGYKPTLFFTFWGLNVLRRGQKVAVKKTWIEKIFGFLMPRGAQKIALSKLHMAGLGTSIMKNIMRKKQVMSLPEMIQMAQKSGVKLVACSMTMDLMGIHKEELIPGVEIGGVATYLDQADQSRINLFI